MSPMIVIAADVLVVVLLVATIATSLRLSRRIAQLKSDESTLRETISELVAVTGTAERAIVALRTTVTESDNTLADRLRSAGQHSDDLGRSVANGEAILARIDQFVDVTRRTLQANPPAILQASAVPRGGDGLRSAVATARAVAERAARRVESRAA